MPTWDPGQYLKFADQRTRPARDLLAQVPLDRVREAMDLGCGPGNSTELLAERWPDARLCGVDSSPEMLAAARRAHPDWMWLQADLSTWVPGRPVDLLFSNAVFQWIPGHERLLPGFLEGLEPGGVLAFQLPTNEEEPARRLVDELADREPWRTLLGSARARFTSHRLGDYYRWLKPSAASVDLWETTYLHVLPGHRGLLDWVKGTAMRPYLDGLDAAQGEAFQEAYLCEVADAYPLQPDGTVLLPFRRLFAVVVR